MYYSRLLFETKDFGQIHFADWSVASTMILHKSESGLSLSQKSAASLASITECVNCGHTDKVKKGEQRYSSGQVSQCNWNAIL